VVVPQRVSAGQGTAPLGDGVQEITNADGDQEIERRRITASRRRSLRCARTQSRGAQRLLASPRRRGVTAAGAYAISRCSTPFGITASPRGDDRRRARCLPQCSTPFGITASPRSRRARSKDRSPPVLNAFRHHRVAEDDGHSDNVARLAVLNAFRHHRVAEDTHPTMRDLLVECSTPFGITASPRDQPCAPGERRLVLNAFRHHRVAEGVDLLGGRRWHHVLNAFRHHRVAEVRHVQRGDAAGLVLNAFRHHRVAEGTAMFVRPSITAQMIRFIRGNYREFCRNQ
jgi:hypothetical protein